MGVLNMRTNVSFSARETMASALCCQNSGTVPLFLRFWHMDGNRDNIPFEWRDQYKRVEWTTSLGICDTLLLQPPLGYIEDYDAGRMGIPCDVTRVEGGRYPVLKKVYHTPAGDLVHEVGVTDDWIYGNDVFLFSDFNVSRAVKHAVCDMEDARKLPYLLGEPPRQAMEEFYKDIGRIRSESRRLDVLIDGGWVALGDSLVDLCGMERVLSAQYEEPELLESVLDTLLAWELKRTEQVLAGGADVIVYMAWYEGCDFWTPANWRQIIKPRLKRLIDLTHSQGKLFRYIMTKGVRPILPDLRELGVDCLTGLDPEQDNVDIREIRRMAGDRMALMGGLSSSALLSQGSCEDVRSAARSVLEQVKEDKGFILFPVDAVFDNQPWENTEALIGAWKEKK
jgi:uroporphyrinogen-III decarboxylase